MHTGARQIIAGLLFVCSAIYVLRKAVPGFFWRTGMGYQDHHDYEMAEKYLLRALRIEQFIKGVTGSGLGVAHISGSLGLLYHHQLRFREAAEMFNAALGNFVASGHTCEAAPVLASLGKLYFDAGDLARSEENMLKALTLFEHQPDAAEERQVIHNLLAAISLKNR